MDQVSSSSVPRTSPCKPPWWRAVIGRKPTDLREREWCEEREMVGCFVTAKEKCVGFARDKCATPFRDARIAIRERRAIPKDLGTPTNYRASELLRSDPECFEVGGGGKFTNAALEAGPPQR
ncbi:hypothetical protein I3843_01G038800 [Carya illinoinensis]|nr:hypothetical protein I3843_01G038800 [Carya illinoinensis]